MILDRTWNKKEQKLTISYIDKLGNRQFYQKYIHHIKSYEYDENGEFETWNGKRCNKVFKDTLVYDPNEFDILEFMYELPKDLNEVMHAQNFPKLYFFDIETEVSDEFPDPEKAEQKVTAISLVGPKLDCIVYGLHNLTSEQQQLFKNRYLNWINENEFAKKILGDHTPKVLYQYFPSEEKILEHFFTIIIPKVACLAGWNSYNFDYRYLVNRCIKLFGRNVTYNMIRKASPTGEIKQISWEELDGTKVRVPGPCHSIILDYMEIVKQYDYILRPYESYSLDWVGNAAVKAHKIKYEGSLQQLYERDPEWYYFYNAVDSLITALIHYKLKAIESPCAVSSITLVPLQAAFGQVALGTANVFEDFYEHGLKVVWDYDAIERVKIPYEGAFCGAVPGRYEFCVCDDFASLYPSQVRTCNLSFENFVRNMVGPDSFGRYTEIGWSEAELEEKRKDPNYFVTVMGNVYKNDKDYAFRRVQAKLKANRDKYKYTGQRIDSQLLVEIDNIINNTGKHTDVSQDVLDVLKDKFNKSLDDIRTMDKDSLIKFREEVEDLKHEYSLLELACKLSGNGLYGCCANRFFYFYNNALAGDITGECRHLTKTMWNNLENFFHETIWQRKDLWKQFDFELDESKHDWYRGTTVSCYSDTDSVNENTKLRLKVDDNTFTTTISKLYEMAYNSYGLFTKTEHGHEIVEYPGVSILNHVNTDVEYVPIKYIIRHKVSKSQYKITLYTGESVKVTGDHSCIVFDHGKQLEISAKDIKAGDIMYSVDNQFQLVASVEQIEDFDNEYVYDIEVNDGTHTFIANDILVHNSVYTTYGNLFKCMTPEYQQKYADKKAKVDWILKFNKEFLDGQNNQWCRDIYEPRHGKNVHEFELETVCYSQIVLKKKKYLKGYAFVKGKFFDKPKVSGTGIEIIKSTTPKLCREILTDLMNSLMFEYKEENKHDYILMFNDKLAQYRKQFYKAPVEDISQSVGVGAYKKYVEEDEKDLILGKACPVSVQAVARFNYLAHKNGEDNKKFYSGKIKYYNILVGQKVCYFGYPAGEHPSWAPPIDKQTQWLKTVIDPINRFLDVMNIPKVNAGTAQQLTLF